VKNQVRALIGRAYQIVDFAIARRGWPRRRHDESRRWTDAAYDMGLVLFRLGT
jgi:hypothetical protein